MTEALAGMDPHKVALPVIALLGLIPVLIRYRRQSRWFVLGYGLLIVATLATNLENIFLGDLLNITEHLVGLMGSAIAFLIAAYVRRQQVVSESQSDGEPHGVSG